MMSDAPKTLELYGTQVPGHQWGALKSLTDRLVGFTCTDVPKEQAQIACLSIALDTLARVRALRPCRPRRSAPPAKTKAR